MGVTRISDWRQPFDAIIDVRSPAEFEDDHIPGAVSVSYTHLRAHET